MFLGRFGRGGGGRGVGFGGGRCGVGGGWVAFGLGVGGDARVEERRRAVKGGEEDQRGDMSRKRIGAPVLYILLLIAVNAKA